MSSPLFADERGSQSQRGLTVIMRREEVGGKWRRSRQKVSRSWGRGRTGSCACWLGCLACYLALAEGPMKRGDRGGVAVRGERGAAGVAGDRSRTITPVTRDCASQRGERVLNNGPVYLVLVETRRATRCKGWLYSASASVR